jgi:raffinose/stachyose/melibiose transport system permease protein
MSARTAAPELVLPTGNDMQTSKPGQRRPQGGRWLGVLLALPAMVLLALFLLWPVLVAADYSTTSASGFGDKVRTGTENYSRVLQDRRFLDSLVRNGIFAAIVVVASTSIGFTMAYVLYLRVRGWRAFQVLMMVPYVTPVVVTALLWQFMLEPIAGLVNTVLRGVGLDALAGEWLTGQSSALWSVSLVHVWVNAPFAMLLIFSAMVSLPEDVLEAAEIDGAGHLRRMASVVFPMMRPIVLLTALILTIQMFRTFDLVYLLTRGGPINSTTISTLYVFVTGFVNNEYGYANAVGVVLGLAVAAVALGARLAATAVRRRATATPTRSEP